jgi:murein DD-endopeptidase MepM/ murein hydrolase activator NlpD
MSRNKRSRKFYFKRALLLVVLVFAIGLAIPHPTGMPVKGASSADYHPESFWFYPWGKSVTHKGVDIFAKEGTPVESTVSGIVLYAGHISMGGEVVLVLGPKWRLHYYAHLKYRSVGIGSFITPGKQIGAVGSTGNAAGKPPHLHYSILSLIPLPWKIDDAPQGWRKMFYLNPIDFLSD